MAIITFVGFTLLVAIIAWWSTRKTDETSSDGYFLGGRSLTGPIIAGSLLLTNLSTEQIVGMNGVSFRDGLPIMAYEVVAAIAMVFTAFVLLPKYLKGGIATIPQFLERRYGKTTKTIVSLLFLLGYAISVLPTVLYSGALAVNTMFDIPEALGKGPESTLWVTVWSIGIIGSIYAILSSFNSALNSSVTLFGLGFYKEYINYEASEKQVVKAGKTFGMVLAMFSMAIALLLYGVEGGVFKYLKELNGMHSVPILAIIILGIFSERVLGKATNTAILFSVVTYLVTLYVVKPDISFLHIMGILFALTTIMLFVVGKFVPRETDYVQEYTKQVDITSWKYLRPVGFSVVGMVWHFIFIYHKQHFFLK